VRALLALAAFGLLADEAQANTGQSAARGVATATVIEPLSVRPLQGLEFGLMTVSARAAGAVSVEPGQPGATYTGGVRSVCAASCASPQSARFEVRGEAGRSYVLTLPNQVATTSENESRRLRIVAIRARIGNQAGLGTTGEINFSGLDYFDLGGTLMVPSGAAPAHYRLNLPIMMAYN
jgi:hypothetical protein